MGVQPPRCPMPGVGELLLQPVFGGWLLAAAQGLEMLGQLAWPRMAQGDLGFRLGAMPLGLQSAQAASPLPPQPLLFPLQTRPAYPGECLLSALRGLQFLRVWQVAELVWQERVQMDVSPQRPLAAWPGLALWRSNSQARLSLTVRSRDCVKSGVKGHPPGVAEGSHMQTTNCAESAGKVVQTERKAQG